MGRVKTIQCPGKCDEGLDFKSIHLVINTKEISAAPLRGQVGHIQWSPLLNGEKVWFFCNNMKNDKLKVQNIKYERLSLRGMKFLRTEIIIWWFLSLEDLTK